MINATIFKMAQRAKIDGLGGERSKIEQFGMFQSSLVKSINETRNPSVQRLVLPQSTAYTNSTNKILTTISNSYE